MGALFKSEHYPKDPESMAARVMEFAPVNDAEALRILRASFPDCPLSARVAALDYLMRRKPRRQQTPSFSR
ncbi:MAG TPA: hypothetical protein VHD59_13110 [Pseudolabrys sp.]|jgi:hypothetical protein|nr:hypothetical protein [Pseudolabrys sp.]